MRFAGIMAVLLALALTSCRAPGNSDNVEAIDLQANVSTRLTAPQSGVITVAFVLAPGAEVVDFAGPWGVFEYANIPKLDKNPFKLYTVAENATLVKCSGGLGVVPDDTFSNAPQPTIIVIPAMGEPTPAVLAWVQEASKKSDLTMSVCNGAFVLAKAGLLSGKTVTAHHSAYGTLAAMFPDVTVKRGARFVDDGKISTAGGLSSGIDLALHVVERYYGRDAAERTARDLEYQGSGWKDPNSNAMFAARPASTDDHPICPVCEMEVSKADALAEMINGRNVYFCAEECRRLFHAQPAKFQSP